MIRAAKALVVRNGKFLTIHYVAYGEGMYDLPGGKLEKGETHEEALLREVQEEIGCTPRILAEAGTWEYVHSKTGARVVCRTFFCGLDREPFANEEGIDGVEWVTKEEFRSLPCPRANLHEMIENVL